MAYFGRKVSNMFFLSELNYFRSQPWEVLYFRLLEFVRFDCSFVPSFSVLYEGRISYISLKETDVSMPELPSGAHTQYFISFIISKFTV